MASVAAMESKLEQLTTIVKSAQKAESKSAQSREQNPKEHSKKDKWARCKCRWSILQR